MVTFVKVGNSVKLVTANGDVYYLSPETLINTRINEGKIYIKNDAVNDTSFFKYLPTEINGRPSDDLEDVAEWLRDTYFVGLTLQATGNIDLGDVTIINGTVANAVNIRDGGNSITVDGTFWPATQPVSATDLDTRDLVFATDKVDASGSTGVGVTGTFWQATQPISAVRKATPVNTSDADGDYEMLQMANGRLWSRGIITDGSDNAFTSNSTAYAGKIAQDTNLLGTLGTAFSTAGKVDVIGTVDTTSNAVVNAANSTSSTLASGAVFTGTSVDILNYSTIRVSLYSDVSSSTNGLQAQFSNDNTNWDFVRQTTYTAIGYFIFNRVARYMRIVYTNGSVAQTVFRLQTLLVPNSSEFARHFLNEPPSDTNTGIIAQSVIYGRTAGTGSVYDAAAVKSAYAAPTINDAAQVVTMSPNSGNLLGLYRQNEELLIKTTMRLTAGLMTQERQGGNYGFELR